MDKVGDLAYVIIDTRSSETGAAFWSQILGRPVSGHEGHFTGLAPSDAGVNVALQQVRTWQDGPGNRRSGIHVDVLVPDLATAVERVESLGGHFLDMRGTTAQWAVMTDPDGNIFCLVTE